jgi:hypothetical protein
MIKLDFVPVVVDLAQPPTVEIDERGFYLIDGQYVPDTETGRLRLEYALRDNPLKPKPINP